MKKAMSNESSFSLIACMLKRVREKAASLLEEKLVNEIGPSDALPKLRTSILTQEVA